MVGFGAAAAGLALFAVGRLWVQTSVVTQGMPRQPAEVSGTDAVAWLPAVALVGLAGVAALLVTGGRGRRVVGALVAGTGTTLAVGAAVAAPELLDRLAEVAAATAAGAEPDAVAAATDRADRSSWRWVTVGAGAALALVGFAAAVRGPLWPGLSRRYTRPTSHQQPAPTAPPGADAGEAGAEDLWRALDQGRDPTAEPPAEWDRSRRPAQ